MSIWTKLFGKEATEPTEQSEPSAQRAKLDLPAWVAREKRELERSLDKQLNLIASKSKCTADSERDLLNGNLSNLAEIVSFLEKNGYFTIENAVNTQRGLSILLPTTTHYGIQVATIPLPRKPDGSYDEMHVACVGSDQFRWVTTTGRFSGRGLDAQ